MVANPHATLFLALGALTGVIFVFARTAAAFSWLPVPPSKGGRRILASFTTRHQRRQVDPLLRNFNLDFLDEPTNSIQTHDTTIDDDATILDDDDDDFITGLLKEISSAEQTLTNAPEISQNSTTNNTAPAVVNPTLSLWAMAALHKAKYQDSTIVNNNNEQDPSMVGVKSVGVDYGLVRTGVATTVGYDPKPLAILSDLNNTQVCEKVIQYARTEQASQIIVGLPLHKNGTVAEQTNLTLIFAQELSQAVLAELGPKVPVELWDERYTSKEAAARAHAVDPNRFLYGSLDADAACIILEHYYHDHGIGRIEVPVVPEELRAECLKQFESRQMKEEQARLNALKEREERMQRRKKAIAEAQRMRETQQNNGSTNGKKKKKKKRKK